MDLLAGIALLLDNVLVVVGFLLVVLGVPWLVFWLSDWVAYNDFQPFKGSGENRQSIDKTRTTFPPDERMGRAGIAENLMTAFTLAFNEQDRIRQEMTNDHHR